MEDDDRLYNILLGVGYGNLDGGFLWLAQQFKDYKKKLKSHQENKDILTNEDNDYISCDKFKNYYNLENEFILLVINYIVLHKELQELYKEIFEGKVVNCYGSGKAEHCDINLNNKIFKIFNYLQFHNYGDYINISIQDYYELIKVNDVIIAELTNGNIEKIFNLISKKKYINNLFYIDVKIINELIINYKKIKNIVKLTDEDIKIIAKSIDEYKRYDKISHKDVENITKIINGKVGYFSELVD